MLVASEKAPFVWPTWCCPTALSTSVWPRWVLVVKVDSGRVAGSADSIRARVLVPVGLAANHVVDDGAVVLPPIDSPQSTANLPVASTTGMLSVLRGWWSSRSLQRRQNRHGPWTRPMPDDHDAQCDSCQIRSNYLQTNILAAKLGSLSLGSGDNATAGLLSSAVPSSSVRK